MSCIEFWRIQKFLSQFTNINELHPTPFVLRLPSLSSGHGSVSQNTMHSDPRTQTKPACAAACAKDSERWKPRSFLGTCFFRIRLFFTDLDGQVFDSCLFANVSWVCSNNCNHSHTLIRCLQVQNPHRTLPTVEQERLRFSRSRLSNLTLNIQIIHIIFLEKILTKHIKKTLDLSLIYKYTNTDIHVYIW